MAVASSDLVDSGWRGVYKVGGICAIIDGILFPASLALFALLGPLPSTGEGYLRYFAGQEVPARITFGTFVLIDILFVPVLLALYLALREVNRNAMLLAAGFLALFVAVDLSADVPNFFALAALGEKYAAATSDVQRAAYVAAAEYATSVLAVSGSIYAFTLPSIGALITSLVMLGGVFGRATAYVGIAGGLLGILASAVMVVPALGALAAAYILLVGVWLLLLGSRLYRLGRL